MTDRYHSFTVVLEDCMREDQAKPLMQAIQQMRGVLKVSGVVSDLTAHMAIERSRREFGDKLMGVICPDN